MKKQLYIFPLFFIIILLGSTVFVHNVGATISYYNWLENPSFSLYENWVEDGSFESGSFYSGSTYGNFSGREGDETITANPHTGVYALNSADDLGGGFWYNFSSAYNNTLGADVQELSFWVYETDGWLRSSIIIYYSDGSSDSAGTESGFLDSSTDTWTYWDCTSVIDEAKFISRFLVYTTYSINNPPQRAYYDDVKFMVDTGDVQDEITIYTEPWYLAGAVGSNYVGIVDDFGHNDNYSCRFSSYAYDNYKIIQDLDYFDAQYILFVSCYAYSAINASEAVLGIECQIAYTDGTVDEKIKYLTNEVPAWEELNFGQSWIDDDKYIQSIRFKMCDDSSSQTIFIDDCSVWVSLGTGTSRFVWTTSPAPLEKTVSFANLYQDTIYTFYCTVYNSTGTANQNGTAIVTTLDGQETVTIYSGYFNFTVDARSGIGDVWEYIGIILQLGNGLPYDEALTVNIQIQWSKISSGTGGTGTGGVGNVTEDFLVNWTLIGILLLAPSLTFAGIGATINPTMGLLSFLGGLTIMGGICLSINVINIGFMFAIIVVDALVILGLLRFGSN